jgi:hypothetical protein
MLPRLLLSAAILIFSAGRANAVIWCSQGGAWNGPCGPPIEGCDRAIRAVYPEMIANHATPAYCGVSGPDGRLRVQLAVDSSWANCARSRIPASAGGVSILIVPASVVVLQDRNTAFYTYSGPTSRKSVHNSKRAAAYSRVLSDHAHRWMALPGVIGIEPAGCDCSHCDYSGVELDVQRHFLESVQKVIASSVNGMPVKVVPRD